MKVPICVALLAGMLTLASCGSDGRAELLVSAAASLTDTFQAIEAEFEERNPDVDVVVNLAGSSALREQIIAGAPADVFASANESVMEDVARAGLLASPARVFATNRLEIAVPLSNPVAVSGLSDFGRSELVLGLCAVGVPCGDFALKALENANVTPAIDTEEPNVRALLTKVESGDLDAGIVYVTDVLAGAGDIAGIPIPDDLNVVARYPIATLEAPHRSEEAAALIAFVLSVDGQAILASHGFGPP